MDLKSVHVSPEGYPCHNFLEQLGGSERTVTVVIAPILVSEKEGVARISWGCSRGPFCFSNCITQRGEDMIYLVRHAQTALSAEGRFQGCKENVPLSKLGVEQARCLQGCLPSVLAFVSPMRRAQETARYALDDAPRLLIVGDLRDVDIGKLGGLSHAEAREQFPRWFRKWERNKLILSCPGGENVVSVYRRVCRILHNLPSDCIIVSHGVIIRLLLALLVGLRPWHYRRLKVEECSISCFDPEKRMLMKLNDTSHLRDLCTY